MPDPIVVALIGTCGVALSAAVLDGHNALAMLVSREGETLSGSEADGLRSYPYWKKMGTSA